MISWWILISVWKDPHNNTSPTYLCAINVVINYILNYIMNSLKLNVKTIEHWAKEEQKLKLLAALIMSTAHQKDSK